MRLRPLHLLVLIIILILIKHRFVFAGRKFFLKKLLKGAVIASLFSRPNYVPVPVPIPVHRPVHDSWGQHRLNSHLNMPHISFSHHEPLSSWHSSRHYAHLPELPFNWNGLSNELQASMISPIIVTPPQKNTNHLSNLSNIPFGLPLVNLNQDPMVNNKLPNDLQSQSFSSNLPFENLIFTPNDSLEPLSARASKSNYTFRKWLKKDLKKNLIE